MILALRVISAEDHPNADRLRVYNLSYRNETPDFEEVTKQVVANLTNVYEVGDIVAVCLPGHDTGDFIIKERKVRGVLSSGMMIGKTDQPVGCQIDHLYEDFEY